MLVVASVLWISDALSGPPDESDAAHAAGIDGERLERFGTSHVEWAQHPAPDWSMMTGFIRRSALVIGIALVGAHKTPEGNHQ